jgi:hypothetical protein
MKERIMKMTNVSNSTSAYILKALLAAKEREAAEDDQNYYELNPADIIKEEDYEESVDGMSYRKLG